jgi:hypothetical protein
VATANRWEHQVTGEVHRIAARRAARQKITVAGGPDLSIKTLGPARIESPLATLLDARQTTEHYVDEGDRVLLDDTLSMVRARGDIPGLYLSSRKLLIFVDGGGPGDGLVVAGMGFQAAVQDSHQAVSQLAQGGLVTEASVALLVVVGAGAG